jgi:hypothetical protein
MPKAELLAKLYFESSLFVLGEKWASGIETNNRNRTLAPDKDWIVHALSQVKAGNLLEVGPGDGSLLRKMRQLGWNSYGIDLGKYASGFQIVSSISQLPDLTLFDVIVFRDVLEHVSNPTYELSKYTDRVRVGATLFMTVPWSESKRARVCLTQWDMVRPIGHLHYFSKQSAKLILDANKFEVFSMETVKSCGSTLDQANTLLHAISRVASGVFQPKRWEDMYNRINQVIMLARCFPDNVGDQLYVRAKKMR